MAITNFKLYKIKIDKEKHTLFENYPDFQSILSTKLDKYNIIDDVILAHDFRLDNKSYIFGSLIKNQGHNIPSTLDTETNKLTDLAIGEKEGLAHVTSFIYDRLASILMLESRKMYAVTVNKFCHFLEKNYSLEDNSIIADIIVMPEMLQKLQKVTQITSFNVKIAKIENGSIFHERNSGIGQILDSVRDTDSITLNYEISGKELNTNKIKDFIYKFSNFTNAREVKRLVIKGRNSEGDRLSELDFLSPLFDISIDMPTKRTQLEGLTETYQKMLAAYQEKRSDIIKPYSQPNLLIQ